MRGTEPRCSWSLLCGKRCLIGHDLRLSVHSVVQNIKQRKGVHQTRRDSLHMTFLYPGKAAGNSDVTNGNLQVGAEGVGRDGCTAARGGARYVIYMLYMMIVRSLEEALAFGLPW